MPTGVEEFVGACVAAAEALIEAGATTSPISDMPDSAGYADFEAQQSCSPPTDAELQEGSYEGPGACVCYDDRSGSTESTPEVNPAPEPSTGDKPPTQQPPAKPQHSAAKAGPPADPVEAAPTFPEKIIDVLTGEEPLFVYDTKYLTISQSLDLIPSPFLMPKLPEIDLKVERIIEDVLGLEPSEDAPELPGDEARREIAAEQGLGTTVKRAAADAVGLGGVADGITDIATLMAEEESGLTAEQQQELERRLAVESLALIVELLKLAAASRGGPKGPRQLKAPKPKPALPPAKPTPLLPPHKPEPKLMTVGQERAKLRIYKEKTGRPAPDEPGVTRWTDKPDKPSNLGRTGENEVTGIWNENKNVKITVTTGANNPSGVKKVELEVTKVQEAKPSKKEHTKRHRRAEREEGFIPKGKDAGHHVPRSLIEFEDPANYSPEMPRYNQQWKWRRAEERARDKIRASGNKDDLTLRITQEYTEGPGPEEVAKSRHVLTRTSDGKDILDVEINAQTGQIIDRTPNP